MRILELSPGFAAADDPAYFVTNLPWTSAAASERVAGERGHHYWRLPVGGHSADTVREALSQADAVVVAAVSNPQPKDELAGHILGERLLGLIGDEFSHLHVLLASHFLVGHGRAHRNAKPGTWSLRRLEAAARELPNDWTIVRPTWLATTTDAFYAARVTQDPHADGLTTSATFGQTLVESAEQRDVVAGTTFAVFDLAVLTPKPKSLAEQFTRLTRDVEYIERAA